MRWQRWAYCRLREYPSPDCELCIYSSIDTMMLRGVLRESIGPFTWYVWNLCHIFDFKRDL